MKQRQKFMNNDDGGYGSDLPDIAAAFAARYGKRVEIELLLRSKFCAL
jgi:hypothetical protein